MKVTTLCLALLAGGWPAGQDSTATLRGTVRLRGSAPRSRPIRITCAVCAPRYPAGMPREDLIVDGEGRIQGAFVYIKAGLEGRKFEVPKIPVVLDQKGCRYDPHILGMMAGQKLLLRNSDPHPHCTHALPFSNKEFNIGLPKQGQEAEKTFENPEVMIRIKDSVDVWMSAWVGVLSHPFFAVTGADGSFEIRGLPPGTYTLAVWQEKCAEATRHIEGKAEAPLTADFTLDLKKD